MDLPDRFGTFEPAYCSPKKFGSYESYALAKPRIWLDARYLQDSSYEIFLERSLFDDLPAVKPNVEAKLRLAHPEDIDEISRLYSSDPWLYIVEGPSIPVALRRLETSIWIVCITGNFASRGQMTMQSRT